MKFRPIDGGAAHNLPELGDQVASHTRNRRSERKAIRVVKESRFEKLTSIEEVADKLFFDVQPPG